MTRKPRWERKLPADPAAWGHSPPLGARAFLFLAEWLISSPPTSFASRIASLTTASTLDSRSTSTHFYPIFASLRCASVSHSLAGSAPLVFASRGRRFL